MSEERKVFHSEGDFQFSLSLKIKKLHPQFHIRNEYSIRTHILLGCEQSEPHRKKENYRKKIDIVLFDKLKNAFLIELKYKTTEFEYQSEIGEKYDLRPDKISKGYYDYIYDIYRLETFSKSEELKREFDSIESYVLFLTNDKRYWLNTPEKTRAKYRNFLINEGRIISGKFECFKKDRSKKFQIFGSYTCKWEEYSKIKDESNQLQNFRSLLVKIK